MYLSIKDSSTSNDFIPITIRKEDMDSTIIGPINVYFRSGGHYTMILSKSESNEMSYICYQIQSNFDIQAFMGKWFQIGSIPRINIHVKR